MPQQPVYPAIQAAPPLAALAPPLAQASIVADPVRIEAPDQQAAASSQLTTELGDIATAYFRRFTSRNKDADTTYGIHDRGGKFYIGDTEIKIDADNISVGNKVCDDMRGLWELIVSKNPSNQIYTIRDKEKYTDILMSPNALKRNNDPNETYPNSSRSPKWVNLLQPIWSKYSRASEHSRGIARHHTGSSGNKGLVPIILPSDQIALLDRLHILLASH
jgi:hypothetical protein